MGADIIEAPSGPCRRPHQSHARLADLLARHAAFVTGTSVRWDYSETDSKVTTRYSLEVSPMDGVVVGPLVGLYPHHWMQLAPGTELSHYALPSVRARSAWPRSIVSDRAPVRGIATRPGPLPGRGGAEDLGEFLVGDTRRTAVYTGHGNGTYWTGKALGSIAQLILVSSRWGRTIRRGHSRRC